MMPGTFPMAAGHFAVVKKVLQDKPYKWISMSSVFGSCRPKADGPTSELFFDLARSIAFDGIPNLIEWYSFISIKGVSELDMWKNLIPVFYILSLPCVAIGSIVFEHVVSSFTQSFYWSRPVQLGMFIVVCCVSLPVYILISKLIYRVVGEWQSFIKIHILCCAILYVFVLVIAFAMFAIWAHGTHRSDILFAYLVLALQCTVLAIVCNFIVLFLSSRNSLKRKFQAI